MALKVGTEIQKLEAGDSVYFDSQVVRGYSRAGGRTCSALVVPAE